MVTRLTIQRRLKTSFDSQHVKLFQTLAKSSWKHFYQIFSSLWGEIIWKRSPWLKFEIIGFLLTHGLPITSILFRIVRICRSLFKSSYLKNKKHFLGFLFHLWNLHQILNIFRKKKIIIANVFPKLTTVQSLVTPLTIQRLLKTSFDSQHVKRFQTLVKSSWKHFYHIFSSLWGEIFWTKSPWLNFSIIGLFVNTWTADYKYLVPDCENLSFLIQIRLSSKKETFSWFFISFMESPSNFKHFQKKDDRHLVGHATQTFSFKSGCIFEISDPPRLRHTSHLSAPSQTFSKKRRSS